MMFKLLGDRAIIVFTALCSTVLFCVHGDAGCNFTNPDSAKEDSNKVNVALGKFAILSKSLIPSISSTSSCSACLAVDGNRGTGYQDNLTRPNGSMSRNVSGCARCNFYEYGSWWKVDLAENYTVTNITIYSDDLTTLAGVTILVDGQLCYTFPTNDTRPPATNSPEPPPPPTTAAAQAPSRKVEVRCTKPVRGRVIRFMRTEGAGQGDLGSSPVIHLCELEVWACKAGYYGEACNKTCKRKCRDHKCDNFHGHCPEGCAVGYYGHDCLTPCGWCREGAMCNRTDGVCLEGCPETWKGPYCNVSALPCACGRPEDGGCDFVPGVSPDGVVNKVNVAFGKEASMSSQFKDGRKLSAPACAAVNGRTSTKYRTLNQSMSNCVHTETRDYSPWWRVDLVENYTITGVTVYRRADYGRASRRLAGTRVWVDNQLCYSFPASNDTKALDALPHKVIVTCSQPLKGSVVSFTKDGDDHHNQFYPINLCEVQVWVCKTGYYGDRCDRVCSHRCLEEVCDNYDGTCTKGCTEGYYGHDCSLECGQCMGGGVCDQHTGHCPEGCSVPGIQPPLCVRPCEIGFSGQNCEIREHCHHCKQSARCNVTTGHCDKCKDHFLAPFCKECENGWYGPECESQCVNCDIRGFCNRKSGVCLFGCSAGWLASKDTNICNQKCPHGTYGKDCQKTCGKCRHSMTCHNEDGICEEGCTQGYQGKHCNKRSSGHGGRHLATGPVAGAIAGGFGLVVISVLVVGICRCRGRRGQLDLAAASRHNAEGTGTSPPPYYHHQMFPIGLTTGQETSTDATADQYQERSADGHQGHHDPPFCNGSNHEDTNGHEPFEIPVKESPIM